jgi:ABC-type multidrug transport system fused ATPase/permease subunit
MKELKQFLWEFFMKNKALFLMSGIFIFIVPIRDILLPLLYSRVVNAISKGQSFVQPLIIVTCLLVLLQVLDFAADYHDTHFLPKLQAFLRSKIMMKLLDKYENSIQELEIGEINTKLVKLPSVITSLIDRMKNFMIPNMLLHSCAIALFFYVDKYLGIAMLITVVIMYIVISFAPQKCDMITMKRDKAFNQLHEEIDDNLRNLYSIYGTNQKKQEISRIERYGEHYNKLYKKTTLCSFKLRSVISPFVMLFIVFLMFRINYIIKKKQVKMSLFIPVFFITLYIINSFMAMDDQLKHIIFDWGIVKSSMDLIRPLPNETKRNSNNSDDSNDGNDSNVDYSKGIGLKNVSFKYPNSNHMILNNLSLHINHGEKVVILGDIGCGKSTVLKLLLKYYKQSSGTVYYDGKSFDDMTIHEIRSRVGYVPQVPVLFNRSIMENILYGNTHTTREEVEELLAEVGLLEDFKKHKNGLDTKVGKNGSVLSGGQRQLVWCLRVMLSNPEVLILDEPTSSIDEKSKKTLRVLLERFMEKKTVIMVTHDPAIVSFGKKFVVIKEGQVESIKNSSSF